MQLMSLPLFPWRVCLCVRVGGLAVRVDDCERGAFVRASFIIIFCCSTCRRRKRREGLSLSFVGGCMRYTWVVCVGVLFYGFNLAIFDAIFRVKREFFFYCTIHNIKTNDLRLQSIYSPNYTRV